MKDPSLEVHQKDEGGGKSARGSGKKCENGEMYPLVMIKHKRVKVEPLSPPSMHSDEDSSGSSWSSNDHDVEQSTQSRLTEETASRTQEIHQTDLEASTKLETKIVGTTNEAVDSESESESDQEDEDQERIPITQTPSKSMIASSITNTTPPQTPPPAAESETAILTNLDDESPPNTATNRGTHHRHDLDCDNQLKRPLHRFRDRAAETRLSEEQREHLNSIIKSIKMGQYNKLHELLESRRDFKRNLLNVHVEGQTALHHALVHGRDLSWCKLLISHGADPNLTNQAGWHPIHLAAYNNLNGAMRYIISCLDPE